MSLYLDPRPMLDHHFKRSHAGEQSFGELVGNLMPLQVEAYQVDYRTRQVTCHLSGDNTHTIALHAPDLTIGERFDAWAVQQAIRGAQQGTVKYPEFLQKTFQAGCIGYTVFIAGKKVHYFGRHGEIHTELFPDSN